MTNPNNAVGTNAAYQGRTSVNAMNDVLATFTGAGVLGGWGISPATGLKVNLGGNGTERDVAIAEDQSGNRTTINNISNQPISVTIPAAPASNSRIDAIVAYVNPTPTGTETEVDNPSVCGLIVVSGTVAANPQAPSNAVIRAAITADGGEGTGAYYAILGTIKIDAGMTQMTASMITPGKNVAPGGYSPSAMTVHGTDSAASLGREVKINLSEVLGSVGDGLEAHDGGIRIKRGSGITKIKVNANSYARKAASEQYLWIHIRKNDENIGLAAINSLSGNYASAVISPVVIDVAEGDVIHVYNIEPTTVNTVITWLTIERI